MPDTPVQSILIVEDNDDDFEATERALRRNSSLANPIERCLDGEEAWKRLNSNEDCSPGLILLDLNMPGMDGRQLLKLIKGDEALRSIPVVIMTTSAEEDDVESCYDMGANTYIRKPISWAEFAEAIARLRE